MRTNALRYEQSICLRSYANVTKPYLTSRETKHRTYGFHSKYTNPTDCKKKDKIIIASGKVVRAYQMTKFSQTSLASNSSSNKFGHSDNNYHDITWYEAVNDSSPPQFRIFQSRSPKGDQRSRTRQLLFYFRMLDTVDQ